LAGSLDDGTISDGITEGHTELDDICAGMNGGQHNVSCSGEIRIATGYIDDQARAVREISSIHSLRLSRSIPISLSPRPETLMTTTSDFFIFGARLMHSATAWEDSSAGMIPSVRARRIQASSASSSEAATYSARPESASAACSGPIEG